MTMLPTRASDLALPASDAIDIAEVAHTVRGQWRAVAAFVAIGVLGALAVVLFAPRRFDGEATLLARSQSSGATSVLGRLTGVSDLVSGGLGGGTSLETELQILRSRALAQHVVDSLQLQFTVVEPERIAPGSVVAASSIPGSFGPVTYKFEREPSGKYRASGGKLERELTPGEPAQLDVGTITLGRELPGTFTLTVSDREDAVRDLENRLAVTKAGGDVIRIRYRSGDSLTAAQVPNALIAFYLQRRKTTDRGVNARRVEFVTRQMDSIAAELSANEHALRRQQENSQVLDAEIVGKAELDGAMQLRGALTTAMVDEGAIRQIIDRAEHGTLKTRDLAAYPAFQRGPSANPLIGQLGQLEAERIRLLERRTANDPEVVALDRSIASLDSTIAGMARTYYASIKLQRGQLQSQYDSLLAKVYKLPEAAEQGGRLKREVIRLSGLYGALQAQLVEARLGEIGEGGDVNQVDVAQPPRKAAFPRPVLTMGVGAAGGLMAGLFAALLLGWFGRYLRDPRDIERLTGVAAQRFESNVPLFIAGSAAARTMLVIPLDASARADVVAQGLARTATARAIHATVLDLSHRVNGASGNGSAPSATDAPQNVGALIDQLEQEFGMVVVQLPAFASDATIAALRETRPVLFVASSGRVDRAHLGNALEVLRRMGVPCAGVVMSGEPPRIRPRTLA